MMKNEMLRKIENREIVVGVVGLGYVGLPLAVEKAKAGFKTIGFDVQAQKVEMVNAGHNYIGDVVDSDLAGIVKSGMLSATTDFSFVKDVDFVAICVPTPLDAHQQPAFKAIHRIFIGNPPRFPKYAGYDNEKIYNRYQYIRRPTDRHVLGKHIHPHIIDVP